MFLYYFTPDKKSSTIKNLSKVLNKSVLFIFLVLLFSLPMTGQTGFDLALTKNVATAVPSHSYGQVVRYNIIIYNQGTADATNIQITDHYGCGLEFNGALPENFGWVNMGNKLVYTYSEILSTGTRDTVMIAMTVKPCYVGQDSAWTNYSEISAATDVSSGMPGNDVDSTPDDNRFNDIGGVPNFNGDLSGTDNTISGENGDEDDHDGHKIQVFDLALRKVLLTGGPYTYGQTMDFQFEVFNQGNVIAKDIRINDYIPAGYSFSANNDWIATSGGAYLDIPDILGVGNSIPRILQLTFLQNPSGGTAWNNYAEISFARDNKNNNRNDDADSISDNNSSNDNQPAPGNPDDDNIFGIGMRATPNQDEDDHDVAAPNISDLEIIKTGPAFANPNESITYNLLIRNNGPRDAINVLVQDAAVTNFTATSVSCINSTGGGVCPNNPGLVALQAGTLTIPSLPSGSAVTLSITGTAGAAASIRNIAIVTPPTGVYDPNPDNNQDTVITTLNQDSRIVNFVWHDLNGNGLQDNGEPGIPGVQVKLFTSAKVLVSTQYSNGFGMTTFDPVLPGNYYLEFKNPNGFVITFANRGANDAIDSDADGSNGAGTTATKTLNNGESDNNIDAGFYRLASIGDLVWYDINKNDIYDSNENGINGLKVRLWRNNFGQWVLYETKFTGVKPGSPSDDGYYKFLAPPGQYYVEVVMPPLGLVKARPDQGFNEENDSDITDGSGTGTTSSFSVVSDQEKCDLGAGYYPMSQAGNLVWRDDNINGIQENFEPKIAGVKVEAIEKASGKVAATSYTDSNGEYNIAYLEQQAYYLKFTPPTGFVATIARRTTDEFDSDVDHSNGPYTTRTINFNSGLANENLDMGVAFGVLPVDWLDVNVRRVKSGHEINWSTANEVNASHYEVERRFEGNTEFKIIPGKVSAQGNTNLMSYYNLIDEDVQEAGVYLYRVKQTDYDGNYSYSSIVKVNHNEHAAVSLYPNPAKEESNIHIHVVEDSHVEIEIFDNASKLVSYIRPSDIQKSGEKLYNVKLDNIAPGIYNVVVTINGKSQNFKLLKLE